MPSANSSTIITISTRYSWKNPSVEEVVSGMSLNRKSNYVHEPTFVAITHITNSRTIQADADE